jgi:uncharacterized repeat protein (TIGR03803 family)
MRSNKFSAAKGIFAILITLLLASAITSAQVQQATKFKVLHTFRGTPNDGKGPLGVLIRDSAGNFYGTTSSGGSGRGECSGYGGCGTAFKMNKAGKLVWLHSFKGQNGFDPVAGLLRDKSGNLYGTTGLGGSSGCSLGCGMVFKLDQGGKETVLHRFSKGSDGYYPEGLLVEDRAGNLYGTTYMGGAFGYGTVFEVSKSGGETILHSFAGPPAGGGDGAYPHSGVIRDTAGNLYGATAAGGADGGGAVYELSAAGSESLLYSFSGPDGAGPESVLVADAAGNLYGTTTGGGNDGCFDGGGCGTVFELSPNSDGRWTQRVLYVFCSLSDCADGQDPVAGPLVLDAAGNLYGTTYAGGAYQNCNGFACGVVFKLEPTGKETVLHSFTGGKDGAFPYAGLTMDTAGSLYGVAEEGGDTSCDAPYGCGVVFKITP